jgi:hypothetical protein
MDTHFCVPVSMPGVFIIVYTGIFFCDGHAVSAKNAVKRKKPEHEEYLLSCSGLILSKFYEGFKNEKSEKRIMV